MDIAPGHTGQAILTVTDQDTALSLSTGDVAVLATPRLVALCEEATCLAIAGLLPEGSTSVAGQVQFDHLVPIKPGSKVTADAVLEKVQGRRLTFTVSASDEAGLVGAGRVTRVVVSFDSFMAKAR